jgi:hypothetical protein
MIFMPSFAVKKLPKLLLVFTILLSLSNSGYSLQLTNDAKITVLTCGPGEALYAIFGHTAIRITDPNIGIDYVYNFGTFDPGTPNFYLKFILGKLDYSLSRTGYRFFLDEYKSENRWIREQEIFYNHGQKQKIFDYLQNSLTDENRRYRYDFFKKNCSTQVIDLILYHDESTINRELFDEPTDISFRKALVPYIGGLDWLNLGINLLLGRPSDATMTRLESCFIPDRLMENLEISTIAGAPQLIYDGSYRSKPLRATTVPMIFAWLILVFMVIEALWLKTSPRVSGLPEATLFGFAGLLGLLIMFLWTQSDHVWLQRNMNILWANPLNVILFWSIPAKKKLITNTILAINIVLISFLLINFGRSPQQFPQEVMPIAAAMAFIILNRFFKFSKKTTPEELQQD